MYSSTSRTPHGGIIIDGNHVADTLRCCHCGKMWIVKHGSGTVRGFCLKCGEVTCGDPGCMPCIPFEKRLDMYEKGVGVGL